LLLTVCSYKVQERLDGLDKRLWRLEAMVMPSTLCVVVAAVSLFMRWPKQLHSG
jgi:hypothetical protein